VIVALTETLFHDLKVKGITNIGVSVVCPGFIRTKIMMAERNRPDFLKNQPGEGRNLNDPETQRAYKFMTQSVENGISPQKAAEEIFNGIQDKKFYILPNAEAYIPSIKTRGENIASGRNPTQLS
jgi:short-subunit dehydrogenase